MHAICITNNHEKQELVYLTMLNKIEKCNI